MTNEPKVIVIHESTLQSWKRDASTFVLAFTCFVPGWAMEMWAMTILGALLLIYWTCRAVLKIPGKSVSLYQARKLIYEIERDFSMGRQ